MATGRFERLSDPSSLNLARSLQSEFSIQDRAFEALCETLLHVGNLSRPKQRRSEKHHKVAKKFAAHVERLQKVYGELDAQTRSRAAALLADKITVNKAPPARGGIAVDLRWRQWKTRQLFECLAETAEFCARGPGRTRPSHANLRQAIKLLQVFWEKDLGRRFNADFGPRDNDLSDPDLNGIHPLNEAAQFCCQVLAEFMPSMAVKSIAGGYDKVSSPHGPAPSRRRTARRPRRR